MNTGQKFHLLISGAFSLTMKYKSVTYRRIKSLGNYQSATLEMTIEIAEDEDIIAATNELQTVLDELLGVPKLSELSKKTSVKSKVENEVEDF